MNFVLFVFLNAILFIRPEELFPAMAGLRLYLIAIVLCTATTLPRLRQLLSLAKLRKRPIPVCVLLLFVSTIVSAIVRGKVGVGLLEFGPEFAKVVLYYLLLIAIVDTRGRFKAFVIALVVLIGILTAIALALHHGIVEFKEIVLSIDRATDPVSGSEVLVYRLVSSGIFNDPNDLCLILGFGILSCIYCATTSSAGRLAAACWLLPLPLFIYAMLETHSRGGVLSILAGAGAYAYSRYGGPKTLPFIAAGVIGILVVIGGRQGNITGGGTAHERMVAWGVGLGCLFAEPLAIPTGLGIGWYTDEYRMWAHNSFVQAYVELGVFGGGAFLGMFVLAAYMLDRVGRGIHAPPWVVQSRHYAFASLVGYAVGCFALTRNFIVPTYLIIGIASVLLEKAAPTLPEHYQVNQQWFVRGLLFSFGGLVFLKYVTQGLGQAGI